jgi:hypothetical protein
VQLSGAASSIVVARQQPARVVDPKDDPKIVFGFFINGSDRGVAITRRAGSIEASFSRNRFDVAG